MSEKTISWHDLTVEDADAVSNFYCAVAGWTREGLSMGDYEDYVMKDKDGDVVAGICHAKGVNANIPPAWLPYVMVDNLEESQDACRKLGGKVLGNIRKMGPSGSYCLIEDPAGAYIMLASGKFGS
jgi:predicted enzyme related to lactoylglutathione lyase